MKDGTPTRTTRMSALSAARASPGRIAPDTMIKPLDGGTPAHANDNAIAEQMDASSAAAAADSTSVRRGPFDGLQWRPPKPRRGPAQSLLGMLGHSDECIGLAKSGRIASCDCRTRPMEDPAVAVGLVLHYARTAITRGLPIPPSVIELLTHHVEEGDPTCIVVARWLDGNGLLDIACKNDDAVGRVQ